MSTAPAITDGLDRILIDTHNKSTKSFWYKIYDTSKDFPEIDDDDRTRKRLQQTNRSSLQLHCGITREQYIMLLKQRGLLNAYGSDYRVNKEGWKKLLVILQIDAEVEESDLPGVAGKRWYIRLGQKHNGYPKKAVFQDKAEVFDPPRINHHVTLQNNLRKELELEKNKMDDDDSSSNDSDRSSSRSDNDDDDNRKKSSEKEDNSKAAQSSMSPDFDVDNEQLKNLLGVLNGDEAVTGNDNDNDCLSPSKDAAQCGMNLDDVGDGQLKYLIGVLLSEQQARNTIGKATQVQTQATAITPNERIETTTEATTEKIAKHKNVQPTVFQFIQGCEQYSAVPIPTHTSDNAYKRYLYHKNYPNEIIKEMGRTKGSTTIDESQGATRMLDYLATTYEDEYIAVAKEKKLDMTGIMNDVQLAAWQVDCELKDWQATRTLKHFRANLNSKVSVPYHLTKKFGKGYVIPRTKKFQHQYDNGEIKTVEVEYQDVSEITRDTVQKILRKHNIKPEDILDIHFVFGGDHGVGAFRLSYRCIVTLKDNTMFHDGGICGTINGKDKPEILEESIMEWLTEDLKRINDLKLFVTCDDDANAVCSFMNEDDNDDTNAFGFKVGIINSGDLKWFCTILGMDGMSNQWCIYCYLRKHQWLGEHEPGEARTVENMKQYSDNPTLKGAARMGVKREPYWPFIPIENYAIPLLHILIGVFNDIDEYWVGIIDSKIVPKSAAELADMEKYKSMDEKIEKAKDDLKKWNESEQGQRRSKLVKRKNTQDKQLAKNEVVADPLSPDDVVDHIGLNKVWKDFCKKRDDLEQDKKDIAETINAYRLARKVDKNSVHNKLEQYAKTQGLDRGKAFGGKFNGKDARKVMENSDEYYDGMRTILKENSVPTLHGYVDKLCDDVIKLMKAWNKFFSLLQNDKPDQDERDSAKDVAKRAVSLHVELLKNKTPKVHVAEDHAVAQYLRFSPGFVRLITEQWVERSHQIGAKDEARYRHITNIADKANCKAESRHKANNALIQKQITWVHSKTARGTYNKRKEPATDVSTPPATTRQRTDDELTTQPDANDSTTPQQSTLSNAVVEQIVPTPMSVDNVQSPQQPATPTQMVAPPAARRTVRGNAGRNRVYEHDYVTN